jgi:hypothetical protein
MKNYKEQISQIVQEMKKEFFAVSRTEQATNYANSIFTKFEQGIMKDSDNNLMFQLLKILAVEGVMENGFRSEEQADLDA